MDADRFDQLTRVVTQAVSRRGVVRSGAVGLTGLLGLRLFAMSSAAVRRPLNKHHHHGHKNKKKGKGKKPNRPKPNAFGCLNVGQHCRGKDSKCCSGICNGTEPKRGEPDHSKCVAHDASTCVQGQHPSACTPGATNVPCTTTAGATGVCTTTTGNGAYCAGDADCFVCTHDTDCEAVCGTGAACAPCATCVATGGTACFGRGGTGSCTI